MDDAAFDQVLSILKWISLGTAALAFTLFIVGRIIRARSSRRGGGLNNR